MHLLILSGGWDAAADLNPFVPTVRQVLSSDGIVLGMTNELHKMLDGLVKLRKSLCAFTSPWSRIG